MKNLIAHINRLIVPAAVIIAAMAPPSHGAKARHFNAILYQYNATTSPQVSYRKFKSRITISDSGSVSVIEIKNYISRKSKPDARVTIAVSGNDAGAAIYNGKNELLAEYGTGKKAGDSLYVFRQKNGERSTVALWFVDDNYIMSDVTISDSDNSLLFKETVIYSARSPSRKK
ncbi:MAG: hypothetical protein ACE5EN_09260 [Nitrospinota bacterium]